MLLLSDIQDIILTKAKSIEICDTLQEVIVATTEDEMVSNGLPLAVFAYQSGIVDDALLVGTTDPFDKYLGQKKWYLYGAIVAAAVLVKIFL